MRDGVPDGEEGRHPGPPAPPPPPLPPSPPAPPPRPAPPLGDASWLSQLFFSWAYPLLQVGLERPLAETDLPALLEVDTSAYNRRHMEGLFEDEKGRAADAGGAKRRRWWRRRRQRRGGGATGRPDLNRALLLDYFRETWLAQLLLAVSMAARLGQSLALGLLIEQFASSSDGAHLGYAWAGSMILCGVVFLFAKQRQFFVTTRKGMTMRLGLLAAIYAKALRLGSVGGTISSGKVVNLASNDVERYQTASALLIYLVYAPLEAVAILVTGVFVMGPAFAAGFGLLLVFLPVQFHLARRFAYLRSRVAAITDRRVGLVSQAVQGCRVMKMHGWERKFAERIAAVRSTEMGQIVSASRYKSVNEAIHFSAAAAVSLATFSVHVGLGGTLTSRTVFTAMSLINLLQSSMVKVFSHSVMYLSECCVSSKRIQGFLETPELEKKSQSTGAAPPSAGRAGGGALVTLSGVTCEWKQWNAMHPPPSAAGRNATPPATAEVGENSSAESVSSLDGEVPAHGAVALSSVDLTLHPGRLYCVIGPVGAGKSALLQCLAGELAISSGEMTRHPSTPKFISYSQQDPWIMDGTVRENIVFGLPDDEEWYRRVVASCGLLDDLREFPSGDATIVGDRGVQCSGGQRARIGLARALYRDADVTLLDDPLSAVDSKVGRLIFYSAIMELCVKRGKCVVLATHQHQFVGDATCILIMEGKIRYLGKYSLCVEASNGKLAASFQTSHDDADEVSGSSELSYRDTITAGELSKQSPAPNKEEPSPAMGVAKESRETGIIKMSTWKNYSKAMGNIWIGALLLVLFSVTQASSLVAIVYMGKWAEQPAAQQRSSFWIGLVFGLVIALICLSFVRARLTFYFCIKASQHLHDQMTASVLRAKISFFDTNPLGRILNRFSADIGIVDDVLPLTLVDFLVGTFIAIGTVATTCVNLPMTLVIVPPLLWYFIKVRKVFTASTRELKRLEGLARSPIYAMIGEALNGVATIRANDATDYFRKKFESVHDQHGRAYFPFVAGSRWFALKLDIIAFLLMSITSILAVLFHNQGWFNISPAVLGLTLTLLMQMAGTNFPWVVRMSAEVVNQMISVERVSEFGDLPSEAPLETDFDNGHPAWPEAPSISVTDLTVRYRSELSPALSGVSFHIMNGQRVGIIGRTGSGKSSLVQALFRLLEAEKGHVIIDGVDVSKLGLHKLRQNISVIPQSPVLFSGCSVRFNLDPFDVYSDEDIRTALKDVQMLDAIEELRSGILSSIAESGSNFSVGQRQLLCLARAVLRKSKILILDEASANIDRRTDALLQATVAKSFTGATILTVAHRLETIIGHDAVLVLGNGKVLEFGSPSELLHTDGGHFAGMIESTGQDHAQFLRQSIIQPQS